MCVCLGDIPGNAQRGGSVPGTVLMNYSWQYLRNHMGWWGLNLSLATSCTITPVPNLYGGPHPTALKGYSWL